jgi:hypothetical protein
MERAERRKIDFQSGKRESRKCLVGGDGYARMVCLCNATAFLNQESRKDASRHSKVSRLHTKHLNQKMAKGFARKQKYRRQLSLISCFPD